MVAEVAQMVGNRMMKRQQNRRFESPAGENIMTSVRIVKMGVAFRLLTNIVRDWRIKSDFQPSDERG